MITICCVSLPKLLAFRDGVSYTQMTAISEPSFYELTEVEQREFISRVMA